ncbi:basement membrane-specific heparan sulfate proteoglycan core protein-like [Saccostrea echinata]|uniref:basement membrane-specific heparan sulfate proteoglycan core protein-like n=1 Tax=Saccostrea echinata TaxID=191078 RepID=UPI002A80BD0A|nr:basement membrane-specific heparan sulfate proteoglycan core protein-like [Saccostrea echinata]
MSAAKSLPHGLLIGLVFVLLIVQGTVNGESSEKDFEFDDVQVVVQKRSVENTLKDDEDFLQDEGSGDVEGSGTGTLVPPTVPEFFRAVINITSEFYTDDLGDRTSVAYRDLSGKVTSAIELLYENVPGQQTIVVLEFSPGSLMVTFDLGSQGFNDRSVLFDTLNNALQSGVISPFSVSPVGFEFRPLQGKVYMCFSLTKMAVFVHLMLEETQSRYPELGTIGPIFSSTISFPVVAMSLAGSIIESFHVTQAMWEFGDKRMTINLPSLEKQSCR